MFVELSLAGLLYVSIRMFQLENLLADFVEIWCGSCAFGDKPGRSNGTTDARKYERDVSKTLKNVLK